MQKYTQQELIDAVKTSKSTRQVLEKLGLKEAGGNYHTIKNKILTLRLDTSHFHGMLWSKGKTLIPLEAYLNNTTKIGSDRLKHLLFKHQIKQKECESCNLTQWLGESIPLELHHVDGNRLNNNLINLQILCPNCHALTSNYRQKKVSRARVELADGR